MLIITSLWTKRVNGSRWRTLVVLKINRYQIYDLDLEFVINDMTNLLTNLFQYVLFFHEMLEVMWMRLIFSYDIVIGCLYEMMRSWSKYTSYWASHEVLSDALYLSSEDDLNTTLFLCFLTNQIIVKKER